MENELLEDILNDLSELIYISDVETYELLYMNEEGMKAFDVKDFKGQKCYKILQGKDEPCEFCTNHFINHNEYYNWKKTNPITGQTYLLKDKLIHWKGKEARIEIAFNQENQIKKEEAIKNLLDIETVLVKCITELHRKKDIHLCIQEMLEIVGQFLEADRSYVFLIHGEYMDNAYEWCREDVSPEMSELQNLDVRLIDRWKEYFYKGECLVIRDIEDIKETESEYYILKGQNIHTLIAAPLESDGELIGYMGVDNPPQELVEKILPFFTTLSYFLSSSIVKQQTESMLEQMSYSDLLTGLYNRNRYTEDIHRLSQQEEINLGIFYIDMNGLKFVNDTYGHDYGDSILKRIAVVLKQNFHKEMIYRIGGDEFIVLYRHQSEENFMKKYHILKDCFENYNCSVAIGYQYTQHGCDIQDAIKNADEMMYDNKKSYYHHNIANRYRFYNDEYLEFTNREYLLKLMSDHRFSIFLQPKMTIKNKQVMGAEVLVRYLDSHDQLIVPSHFLPILENCGLIYLLDFFVLDRTCQVIVDWLKKGYQVYPVSVNLSSVTIHHPEFIKYLHDVWGRYQLPKELVEFEITKNTEGDSLDGMLNTVQAMKDEGYHIVIDDFGSNQSNVFLFSSVAFDVVKLEKSLVHKLIDNDKIYALVASLIKACHKLGVSIVAKGVENFELLQVLEKMDVDEVQGYLFSGPVSLDEFTTKYVEGEK